MTPVAHMAAVRGWVEDMHLFAAETQRMSLLLGHATLLTRELLHEPILPIALADIVGTGGQRTRALTLVTDLCNLLNGMVGRLIEDWRERLGGTCSGSATDLLLGFLPGMPIFSVVTAIQHIDKCVSAIGEAFKRLLAAGIIRPQKNFERSKVYVAQDVLDCFDVFSHIAARRLFEMKGTLIV
jgi:hypothetical protein